MCIILCFDLDEDWEEQHEKLAELLGEKSRDEENHSRIVYELEDDEECAYPGPPPQHLRQGRIDDRGNFAFDQDNEDAADVAASVAVADDVADVVAIDVAANAVDVAVYVADDVDVCCWCCC